MAKTPPELPITDGHFGWQWHEAAKRLVGKGTDNAWFREIVEFICTVLFERRVLFGNDYLRELARQLMRKAPEEVWNAFSVRMEEGTDLERHILFSFLAGVGLGFDEAKGEPVLWQLSPSKFTAWISAHREFAPLLLDQIRLYTVTEVEGGPQRFHWHPFALELIQQCKDEETALREIYGNLYSFGSTGSRIPYWERRFELAQQLSESEDPKLRRIGRTLTDQIAETIEHTKREEQNEHARFH